MSWGVRANVTTCGYLSHVNSPERGASASLEWATRGSPVGEESAGSSLSVLIGFLRDDCAVERSRERPSGSRARGLFKGLPGA